MEFEPIGTVETPIDATSDAPRQGAEADVEGVLHVDPAHEAGLRGVEPGQSLDVVWVAHRADRVLTVGSHRGDEDEDEDEDGDGSRGVFATRSPARPNPICVTTVEVLAVDGTDLAIRGVDMLDGSPVLDVKRAMR
jgi:tRNA-Thr(GGU) m(6)t(6)A37 methyltransferase TsaA